jgi:hypothetical protein
VPPVATDTLAALIPHATVWKFPDAGHFFVFEVWDQILSWLVSDTGLPGDARGSDVI